MKKAEPWASTRIVLSGLEVGGGAKMSQYRHRVYCAPEVSPPPLPKDPWCSVQLARKGSAGPGRWQCYSSDEKHGNRQATLAAVWKACVRRLVGVCLRPVGHALRPEPLSHRTAVAVVACALSVQDGDLSRARMASGQPMN